VSHVHTVLTVAECDILCMCVFSVQGLWFMCRGEKTPWGTHIGGEEYPPDCKSPGVAIPKPSTIDLRDWCVGP